VAEEHGGDLRIGLFLVQDIVGKSANEDYVEYLCRKMWESDLRFRGELHMHNNTIMSWIYVLLSALRSRNGDVSKVEPGLG
jgi:hypothetical protein